MTTPQTSRPAALFKTRGDTRQIEQGSDFSPKLDEGGLIGAIVTSASSGAVLMFAHMNAEAFAATMKTGYAHFWSRSRAKLWKKGEESGNLLRVRELRTDCDQDVLWIIVDVEGSGVACHTGETSCFYRRIVKDGPLDAVHLQNAALPRTD